MLHLYSTKLKVDRLNFFGPKVVNLADFSSNHHTDNQRTLQAQIANIIEYVHFGSVCKPIVDFVPGGKRMPLIFVPTGPRVAS